MGVSLGSTEGWGFVLTDNWAAGLFCSAVPSTHNVCNLRPSVVEG